MSKNKIGLICAMLLMGLCSFGQNGEKNTAKHSTNNPNKNSIQKEATILYSDYLELVMENESLYNELEAKEDKILSVEMKLKYLQLREELETGKLSNEFKNDISEERISDSSANVINIRFFLNGPYPECKSLFAVDSPNFKKVYPLTYNAIKNGMIKLNDVRFLYKVKSQYREIKPPLAQAQYKVIEKPNAQKEKSKEINPPLSQKTNKNKSKVVIYQEALAEDYLKDIKELSNVNYFDFDVMKEYQKWEEKEAPNKEIVKLIEVRKRYINHLRNLYNESN